MRRRLLLSYLAIAALTVLLIYIPLMIAATTLISSDFDQRLQRNLQNTASAVEQLLAGGHPVDEQQLAALIPPGRRAIYQPRTGRVIAAGHVSGAVRSATALLPTGRLRMESPLSVLHSRQLHVRELVTIVSLVTLGLAAALALGESRRISRPLQQLADTAERFGRGDLRPSGIRYSVPELSRLGAVLDGAAINLGKLVESERRFARDTSHQLRTPLAGLSLRLEGLLLRTTDQETAAELRAAIEQVHRLSAVADAALQRRSRPGSAPVPIDVTSLLTQLEVEWRPILGQCGRDLLVVAGERLTALATTGALIQALSTLIENAVTHGGGQVSLHLRRIGSYVAIDVSDCGPGVPPAMASAIFEREVSGAGGTGLGLPLARSLVEADGGRLELTSQRPARFTVFLPEVVDSPPLERHRER